MESEFKIIRISDGVANKIEEDMKIYREGIPGFVSSRCALLALLDHGFISFVDERAKIIVDPLAYRHGAFLLQYAVSEYQRAKRASSVSKKPVSIIKIQESDLLNGFIHGEPGIFKGSERFFQVISNQGKKHRESVSSMITFWVGVIDTAGRLTSTE